MGGTGLEPVTPSLSSWGSRSRQFAGVRSGSMVELNPPHNRTLERTRTNADPCHFLPRASAFTVDAFRAAGLGHASEGVPADDASRSRHVTEFSREEGRQQQWRLRHDRSRRPTQNACLHRLFSRATFGKTTACASTCRGRRRSVYDCGRHRADCGPRSVTALRRAGARLRRAQLLGARHRAPRG
jgi:hypothetical protein